MTEEGWVYIMASERNGTLYLGVTSNPRQRVWQHRTGALEGFSKKYGCHRLVWIEHHPDLQDARRREWQMKKWKRAWKLEAIEQANPQWRDLFDDLMK